MESLFTNCFGKEKKVINSYKKYLSLSLPLVVVHHRTEFWGQSSHTCQCREWQRRHQDLLPYQSTSFQVWRQQLSHTPGQPWQQRRERREGRGQSGRLRNMWAVWNIVQVHLHNLNLILSLKTPKIYWKNTRHFHYFTLEHKVFLLHV